MTDDEKVKRLLSGKYCGNCVKRIEISKHDIGCYVHEASEIKTFRVDRLDYCDKWVDEEERNWNTQFDVSITYNGCDYTFKDVQIESVGWEDSDNSLFSVDMSFTEEK